MKIFYHMDNDGKCAGFWVYQMVKPDQYGIECVPINYDIPFPFEKINPNEKVYIVDYSIFPEEMDKLLGITPNVIWIDHHKTAIERYKDYDKEIRGIRYDGIAGCMLTFCYLHFMINVNEKEIFPFDTNMTKHAPLFTKYIADYDVWTFKYGDETRAFEKGLSLYPHNPEDEIWQTLLIEDSLFKIKYRGSVDEGKIPKNIQTIIDNGKTITAYRYNIMKDYCEKKGFEATLDGHKCYAVNMAMMSSNDFIIDNADEYDLFVGFSFNGKMWNYSLRSTKIDCSEIAKKYGGGGHVGAAGCNTKEFILEVV